MKLRCLAALHHTRKMRRNQHADVTNANTQMTIKTNSEWHFFSSSREWSTFLILGWQIGWSFTRQNHNKTKRQIQLFSPCCKVTDIRMLWASAECNVRHAQMFFFHPVHTAWARPYIRGCLSFCVCCCPSLMSKSLEPVDLIYKRRLQPCLRDCDGPPCTPVQIHEVHDLRTRHANYCLCPNHTPTRSMRLIMASRLQPVLYRAKIIAGNISRRPAGDDLD